MGIGSILGTYGDFVLGTGQSTVTDAIKNTIKYRKAHGLSYGRAFTTGVVRGVKKSNTKLKINGGFFKSLKTGLSAIPNGWKAGKGFGKLTGAIKGCGKAMPALFAGLLVLGEIPNVYKAVRDKGVVQGLKEVGKTAVRLTAGAACGTILGALLAPIPGGSLVGGMGGWMLGDWLASKIVGKSYSEKVAEAEEQKNPQEASNTPVATGGDVAKGENVAMGDVQYPSIHANDFGPYRPYSNIFFNNPAAYADFGARMPGQENTLPGYASMGTMMPMMGGVTNNQSGNLLDNVDPKANLLNTANARKTYTPQSQIQQGANLDLSR